MAVCIKPQIYAALIPKGNIHFKPLTYVSQIPNGKIIFNPLVFVSYIPTPVRQISVGDTFRSVEFLSGLSSPKLKYKIGNQKFSVGLFSENKSPFGALAVKFGNQKLFAELTESTADNAGHTRIKIDGEKYSLANKRLKTIPINPTLAGISFVYTGNVISPNFTNFYPDFMILSGEFSGTDCKTYTAKIYPLTGHKWIDGTTSPKIFDWSIDFADLGDTLDITKFADGKNFEYVNGSIRSGSNSYNVNNGVSRSFAKFAPKSDGNLIVSCSVSSESGYDIGGITISTEKYEPTISQLKNKTAFSTGGYIFSGSGVVAQAEYSYPLTAEQTYIIGLHYLKDGSANRNDDRFYLYSMRFESA